MRAALFISVLCAISPARAADAFDHSYAAWGRALKKHVYLQGGRGRVDYKALKADGADLTAHLAAVESLSKEDFSRFSGDQKLAFLINTYNALTVKLVLDHYPVKSIKKIGWLFSSPWRKKFFKLFGKPATLDEIEHELIRGVFHEPRIHFALNCAARSCPPLQAEPYMAPKLDDQLEKAATAFLKDPSRNRFDATRATLHLSPIFKWYSEDFGGKSGSVLAFAAARMGIPASDKPPRIQYLDYDWSLNEAIE